MEHFCQNFHVNTWNETVPGLRNLLMWKKKKQKKSTAGALTVANRRHCVIASAAQWCGDDIFCLIMAAWMLQRKITLKVSKTVSFIADV